ncbi:hypothetical protein [Peterkaempfera sp. SMS 1(5)a]|uniref:hypothetical protein n=1 Tax=Peterkaempfera podocarpi TaxID=3232308 RepID=UPI00367092AC
MVIENGTLWISHYTLGFDSALADNIAKNVIGLGLGTMFRFISFRTWVFRALPQLEEPAAEAEGEPALALAGHQPAQSAAEA